MNILVVLRLIILVHLNTILCRKVLLLL